MIFLFSKPPRPTAVPSQPPVITGGVDRRGRNFDHLALSSAESKNEWSYTSFPLYAFTT